MLKNNFDCVVVANGEFPSATLPLSYLDNAPYIIACDGALQKLKSQGFSADAIVGDLDSLSSENRELYGDLIFHDPDQETNDLTKAMKFARSKGFRQIMILGATGLREDHMLGNISLLLTYNEWFEKVVMMSDYGYFRPINRSTEFECFERQQISIFALYPHGNLSSEGLRYPIRERNLPFWWEGTLNETTGTRFSLHLSGEGNVLVYFKSER